MKRTCLLTLLLCLLLTPALLNATPPAISAPATTKTTSPFAYRGFSGGMMLHAGWVDCGDMRVGLAPVQVRKKVFMQTPPETAYDSAECGVLNAISNPM